MKKILTLCLLLVCAFAFNLQAKSPPKTKKEKVTFKKFNENDPKSDADNTVTVISNGEEVEKPIEKTWNEKHLKFFQQKDVNLTSTMNPETGQYIVTNVEPFIRY